MIDGLACRADLSAPAPPYTTDSRHLDEAITCFKNVGCRPRLIYLAFGTPLDQCSSSGIGLVIVIALFFVIVAVVVVVE